MMPNMDELMAENVANGFYEVSMDDDGEFSFRLSENAAEINPTLYRITMKRIEDEMIDMVDKGLLRLDFNDDLEPTYELTPLGEQVAKSIMEAQSD